MTELLQPIGELLERLLPYAIAAAVIAVTTIVAGAFLTQKLGARYQRWKRKMSKEHWRDYLSLLSNQRLTETYTPDQTFIEDYAEEGRKPLTHAWISPYKRPVKASSKRHGRTPKGQFFNARRQIRELAKRIHIRDLTEWELQEQGGTGEDQFIVELALDGKDRNQIRALKGNVQSQLGLASIEEIENKDAFKLTFIAKETDHDPLTDLTPSLEFFEENPATNWQHLPLGVKANGQPWALPLHHTMVLGTTGSGKGSIIHAVIRQLFPLWKEGLVEFWGIDPKGTELKPYAITTVFKEVAIAPNDQPALLNKIYNELLRRSGSVQINLEKGNLGRDFKASENNPLIVLVVDELLSVLQTWAGWGKEGKELYSMLTQILAQGRSLGIYVIAATQDADKTLMGNMRNNFANAIILKQSSVYMNDLFLGAEAAEKGFDSTAIPSANASNNYRTAGIGYAKEEAGDPVKLRIAYSNDQMIADLIKAHQRQRRTQKSEPAYTQPVPIQDEALPTLEAEQPRQEALPTLETITTPPQETDIFTL